MNTYNLGGFAIWSLDLDDHEAKCEEVPFIVLRTLLHIITEQKTAMQHLEVASGRTKLVGITLSKSVLEYDKDSTLPVVSENNYLNFMESEFEDVRKEDNKPDNMKSKSLRHRFKFANDVIPDKILDGTTKPTMEKMDPSPIKEPPPDNSPAIAIFESTTTVVDIDKDSAKVYINLDYDQDVEMNENEKNTSAMSKKEDGRIHKRVGRYAEVLWNAFSSMMDSVTVIVADEMRSFIPGDIMAALTNSEKNTKTFPSRKKRSSELGKCFRLSFTFQC